MSSIQEDGLSSLFNSLVDCTHNARLYFTRGSTTDSLQLLQEARRIADYLERRLVPAEHDHSPRSTGYSDTSHNQHQNHYPTSGGYSQQNGKGAGHSETNRGPSVFPQPQQQQPPRHAQKPQPPLHAPPLPPPSQEPSHRNQYKGPESPRDGHHGFHMQHGQQPLPPLRRAGSSTSGPGSRPPSRDGSETGSAVAIVAGTPTFTVGGKPYHPSQQPQHFPYREREPGIAEQQQQRGGGGGDPLATPRTYKTTPYPPYAAPYQSPEETQSRGFAGPTHHPSVVPVSHTDAHSPPSHPHGVSGSGQSVNHRQRHTSLPQVLASSSTSSTSSSSSMSPHPSSTHAQTTHEYGPGHHGSPSSAPQGPYLQHPYPSRPYHPGSGAASPHPYHPQQHQRATPSHELNASHRGYYQEQGSYRPHSPPSSHPPSHRPHPGASPTLHTHSEHPHPQSQRGSTHAHSNSYPHSHSFPHSHTHPLQSPHSGPPVENVQPEDGREQSYPGSNSRWTLQQQSSPNDNYPTSPEQNGYSTRTNKLGYLLNNHSADSDGVSEHVTTQERSNNMSGHHGIGANPSHYPHHSFSQAMEHHYQNPHQHFQQHPPPSVASGSQSYPDTNPVRRPSDMTNEMQGAIPNPGEESTSRRGSSSSGSKMLSIGNMRISNTPLTTSPSKAGKPQSTTTTTTMTTAGGMMTTTTMTTTPVPLARPEGGGTGGARTQFHAPLEPEVVKKLDEIFFRFLQRICSDLNACDSKGDHIHQPLMAKKMQRLEASTEFRPFKFRIQAFTNAFHDSLITNGLSEDILPLRKVKLYLWKHKYISRFNEDGKKQKSKGNHVWNIEARKLSKAPSASTTNGQDVEMTLASSGSNGPTAAGMVTTGIANNNNESDPPIRWEFREYSSRIAGQIIKFARVGVPYVYSPRIWDAQMSCPAGKFASPWLPGWLKWHKGELKGVPGPDDQSCTITVIAEYMREGEECRLEMSFPLTVSDPSKEGDLTESQNEQEDEDELLEDDEYEDRERPKEHAPVMEMDYPPPSSTSSILASSSFQDLRPNTSHTLSYHYQGRAGTQHRGVRNDGDDSPLSSDDLVAEHEGEVEGEAEEEEDEEGTDSALGNQLGARKQSRDRRSLLIVRDQQESKRRRHEK